jgi:hypothetical protein
MDSRQDGPELAALAPHAGTSDGAGLWAFWTWHQAEPKLASTPMHRSSTVAQGTRREPDGQGPSTARARCGQARAPACAGARSADIGATWRPRIGQADAVAQEAQIWSVLHGRWRICMHVILALTDLGKVGSHIRLPQYSKGYSKALEYEYRVKTTILSTLKRYFIISLTLY